MAKTKLRPRRWALEIWSRQTRRRGRIHVVKSQTMPQMGMASSMATKFAHVPPVMVMSQASETGRQRKNWAKNPKMSQLILKATFAYALHNRQDGKVRTLLDGRRHTSFSVVRYIENSQEEHVDGES